jgi:adenylyl-sulfate kinase
VVWLTGLPGSGKSTLAALLTDELSHRGRVIERLDGDVVRKQLAQGLGFSKEDRYTNILHIGRVASRLAHAGRIVVVAVIAPYEEARRQVRAMAEPEAAFVEIHLSTSLAECVRRDPKGMYAKAIRGEIQHFTGISDPYEEPQHPELRLDTAASSPDESVAAIVARLVELGLVDLA